jgi:hypothetical protein
MKTKTKTDCKTKNLCHYDSLTRTKFFHGMLLTDEHLRDEQTYHREALKRLNRHLWGSGIVCGLEVEEPAAGLCIKVHPGLALDCDGNVIDVCKCVTIDLSDLCRKAYPDGCAPQDPADFGKYEMTKYLVLRYREIPADPQPVLTPDDDCVPADGTRCEASKYREGFCLEFADECPDCAPCAAEEDKDSPGLLPFLYQLSRGSSADVTSRFEQYDYKPDCMEAPPCRDCDCDDSAVGLAKLVIDCANNTVQVECDDCRHYVWSPRLLRWLICGLFAQMDRIPKDGIGIKRNLPSASALYRNPLHTAWEIGEIAVGTRGGVDRLHQELRDLTARVAAVEKTRATAKARPRRDQAKTDQEE